MGVIGQGSSATMRFTCFCLFVVVVCGVISEARYLPTRSQEDRLDKLRELLRDLLENETQRGGSDCGGAVSGGPPPQVYRDLGVSTERHPPRYFKRDIRRLEVPDTD